MITNLSNKDNLLVTSFGRELNNKNFLNLYNLRKKNKKKLPYIIKKALPVIKTLEGSVYIPHLNIYNDISLKNLVIVDIIDYYNIYI